MTAPGSVIQPYYSDKIVTLYCGRMEDVLPELGRFDACVTDPPYGETSLPWDRWPDGWPAFVAEHTSSLWTFGSMRMFLRRHGDLEAAGWKLAQDTVGEFEIDTMVWEKGNGSGAATDRFRRVHELATQWYRGLWREVYHVVPRVPSTAERVEPIGKVVRRPADSVPHQGVFRANVYVDDGLRLARSVIRAKSMRGRAIHPTEKPVPIISPLIEYSVPPGGVVLDPFAGSCSTGLTARQLGRRAVLIEADEAMCEKAVTQRLAVPDLFNHEDAS